MKKNDRLYVYPMDSIKNISPKNPYRYNLIKSLTKKFEIVNYGYPSLSPLKDLFHYFKKSNLFLFNWIEQLSWRQIVMFIFFMLLCKIAGKKIVWTHHNIHPHKGPRKGSSFMIWLLKKFADYVILHTSESFNILSVNHSDPRVLYYFHPFFENNIQLVEIPKSYDLLIWGNVRKSKGVHEFLEFLASRGLLDQFRIKIVGKFESKVYYEDVIRDFKGRNIHIENRFIDDIELNIQHARARYIFFPYTGSSVLNSGALITSLPKGSPIIGPYTGAFKEAGILGLITCYKDFEEVIDLLNKSETMIYPHQLVENYILKYTWGNFSEFLYNKLVK